MSSATIIWTLVFIQESLGLALPPSPIVGIEGGHPVHIADAPFMAALLRNDLTLRCGGSIIHEQFVLTSATCTQFPPLVVRVGSSHFNEGGELHQVEKYIVHEAFSYETFKNNVALLKLSEPVTLGPSVNIIKLADDGVHVSAGLVANVTGWGGSRKSWEVSRDLQQVLVTVSPPGDCDRIYETYGMKLSTKQICVNNKYKGVCTDDAGGPLTAGNLQIGITSFGPSCTFFPTVYEKVAAHLMWIRHQIKQNYV